MADLRWTGAAVAVIQVQTNTVGGTIEVGDKFIDTFGAKAISHSATTTVVNTTAAAIADALQALSTTLYPELGEVTVADASGAAFTITGNTAGYPFTDTVSTTESDGSAADAQTYAATATTACSGPNFFNVAANWSGGALYGAGDNIFFENVSARAGVDVLYGLSAAGTTLGSATIAMSFEAQIGLAKYTGRSPVNHGNGVVYPEYRTDHLTVDCSLWNIGVGEGQGSGRWKINAGTVQTLWNVYNTGTPIEDGIEALLLKGTHASNVLNVTRGSVGVAVYGGEVATVLTARIDGGNVRFGSGVTLGTITVNGGTVHINCAIATSITAYGGTTYINGTGAVAALAAYGNARIVYNTTGTLGGAPVVYGNAVIDFSQDPRAKTVTNPINTNNIRGVYDPDKVVASLVVDYEGKEPIPGLGQNIRVTRGAVA